MAETLGCGKCPKCGEQGTAITGGRVFIWRCRKCQTGSVTGSPPTKCPTCGDPVEIQVLAVPDLCICDKCRHTFPLSPVPVEAPTKEELEKMWQK
jgi:ribosomal protein L37AE/L43A